MFNRNDNIIKYMLLEAFAYGYNHSPQLSISLQKTFNSQKLKESYHESNHHQQHPTTNRTSFTNLFFINKWVYKISELLYVNRAHILEIRETPVSPTPLYYQRPADLPKITALNHRQAGATLSPHIFFSPFSLSGLHYECFVLFIFTELSPKFIWTKCY